jgi:hypothetical protein
MFQESVRRLSLKHFAPKAFTWETGSGGSYPWENAKILAENGLMGMRLPEEEGGQGATLMDCVIAIMEITKVCPHTGDVFQAGNFGAIQQVAFLGNEHLKKAVLPKLLAGETIITGDVRTERRIGGHRPPDDRALRRRRRCQRRQDLQPNGASAGYFCVWCRFWHASSGAQRPTTIGFAGENDITCREHHCMLDFDECRVRRNTS